MLDSIIKSLASETGQDLVSKAGVPADKLDDLFKVTGEVAQDEIKNQVSNGGLDTIMNLFSSGKNNNFADNLQGNLINNLVSSLGTKLGLSKAVSTQAANFIVPTLVNLVTNENSKTPDDDPSPLASLFDLGNLAGSGNTKKSGGLGGIVKGLFGK